MGWTLMVAALAAGAGSAMAGELRGTLQGRRVLRTDESPVSVPSTVTVPQGSSLWIEPGVVLRLGEGACLVVEGELHALGEKKAPVRFEPAGEGVRWGNVKILGDKDLPGYDGDGNYIPDSGASRLQFCEFRGGGRVPDEQYDGGALYMNGSAPLVSQCLFQGNEADRGGALVAYNFATPLVESCTFEGNASLLDDGGAIYCFFYSDALIRRNFIVQNRSARHAGGLYISVSNPLVQENAFIDNTSTGWGGGIYVSSSSPRILDNAFYECVAEDRSTGLVFQADCRPEVKGNSLLSGGVEVYGLNLAEDLDLSGNWWGTTDEYLVQGKVQQRGRGQDRTLRTAPWRDRPVANLLTQPVEIHSLHAMADRAWGDTLAFDLCDQAVARLQITAVDRNRYAVDQTHAEVGILERPGKPLLLVFTETGKNSGVFRARLGLNRDEEDTPRLDVRVGEHLLFTSVANPEVKRLYRVDEARPVVHGLAVLSDPDPTHLVADTLRLGWQYFSLLGEDQSAWQLQVDSDSLFSPAELWDSGTRPAGADTRTLAYQGRTLADGERYFLRLRVQGGGAWSDWKRFVIRSDNTQNTLRLNSLPPVPTLATPAAEELAATLRPRLSLQPAPDREGDPVGYDFQVAEDEFFQRVLASTRAEEWREPAWTVDRDLRDNGTYWARVRVFDGFEHGDWSAPRRFHCNPVEEAPAALELAGPQGVHPDLRPELGWGAAADPDPLSSVTYTLLLSSHEDLREARRVPAGEALALRLPAEFPNRVPVFWAVEAKDNSGRATRSRQVLRLLPDTTPSAPAILYPTAGEEAGAGQPVRFTPGVDPWPQDQLLYEIQAVAGEGDFAKPLFHLKDLSASELAGQGVEAWASSRLLAEDQAHRWRLRAVDNHGVASEWSEPASFWMNRSNAAPGAVALQEPADKALLRAEPLLAWTAAADPDHSDPPASLTYVVQLSRDGEFRGQLLEERVKGLAQLAPAGRLGDNARWFWRVQALDDQGAAGPWSPVRAFVLNQVDEAPAGLAWTSPAEGARLHRLDQLELAWTEARDVDPDARLTYRWSVVAASAPDKPLAQGQGGGLQAVAKAALESRADYLLRLAVVDETGLEQALPPRRVTVDSHPTAPVLVEGGGERAPADLLAWSAATDPDPSDRVSYRVELDAPDGRNLLKASGLTATQVALQRLPGVDKLPEDGEVVWRVAAVDPHGLEAVSGQGRFWFNRANQAPTAPAFATGLGEGVQRTDRPALAFTPGVDSDHSDPPASLWHEVQVAATATFASPVTHRVPAGQATVADLVLGDNARWHLRLRCLDDQGTAGPWSAPLVLTVNRQDEAPSAPQLTRPVGPGWVDLSGLDLAWTASVDADPDSRVRYRVRVEDGAGALLAEREADGTSLRLQQAWRNDQELRVTVAAVDEGGLTAISTPLRLLVDSRPGSCALSGRAGQVLAATDALAWTEAADPDPADRLLYDLVWSTSRASVEGKSVEVAGLRLPLGRLEGLPENGEVWLRVRARDNHGLEGPWSEPWNLIYDNQAEPPLWNGRLRPAGGEAAETVPLAWEPPTDPDRRPQQLKVEVQSATDDQFRQGLQSRTVDAAEGLELRLRTGVPLHVRARAVDASGKTSAWSPVEVYLRPAPVPVTPESPQP